MLFRVEKKPLFSLLCYLLFQLVRMRLQAKIIVAKCFLNFKELSGGIVNADSDSGRLRWDLRFCISNKLMLLV